MKRIICTSFGPQLRPPAPSESPGKGFPLDEMRQHTGCQSMRIIDLSRRGISRPAGKTTLLEKPGREPAAVGKAVKNPQTRCRRSGESPVWGPSRILGVHAQVRGEGTSITEGTSVLFNTMLNDQSLNIHYTLESGIFYIAKPGNYFVTWQVNVHQKTAGLLRLGLRLNGRDVTWEDRILSRGSAEGAALITVSTLPGELSLVNLGSESILYDGDTPVRANIVILEA